MTKEPPVLIALTEASRRLGLSLTRIRTLVEEGKLPALKDSARRHLFFPEDIERLRQKREQARSGGKVKIKLTLKGEQP
jgi:excisionase family DNA binding protein